MKRSIGLWSYKERDKAPFKASDWREELEGEGRRALAISDTVALRARRDYLETSSGQLSKNRKIQSSKIHIWKLQSRSVVYMIHKSISMT